MGLMELTALRNAHVGSPGISGLSVEQRKRLTIGVELVANPSIIFMDVSLSCVYKSDPLELSGRCCLVGLKKASIGYANRFPNA